MRVAPVPVVILMGCLVGCFDPDPSNPADTDATETGTSTTTDPTTGPGTTSPSTSGGEESSSSGTPETTTGVDPECEAPAGQPDPACAEPSPLCIGGECAACEALAGDGCAGVDVLTPICDPESGACSPCDEHEQCATGACIRGTGQCVADEHRFWVDRAATCGAGSGTEADPLCSISEAIDAVNSQPGEDPWAIFVAGSALPYEETFGGSSDHAIAVIGPSSGLVAEINGGDDTAVIAAGGAHLYLAHLQILSTSMGRSVTCFYAGAPTSVWLDDVTVIGSGEPFVFDCDARVRRSMFDAGPVPAVAAGELVFEDSRFGPGEGLLVEGTMTMRRSSVVGPIEVVGGAMTLENSFVQHDPFYPPWSVNSTGGGTVDVVYSTIETGFTCDGNGPTSIRNSIVMGVACPSTRIDNSAVEGGVDQGDDNALFTPADLTAILANPGDLHIVPNAMTVDGLAVWRDGDPLSDIDHEPRPTEDGAADYAGADVP